MGKLVVILGDQLSQSISSLRGFDRESDRILMCEVKEEADYVKHHQKKLVFVFSAMRHFAKQLLNIGFAVDYIRLDDPDNSGSITGEVERLLQRYQFERILVTHPGEYRVLCAIEQWKERFLCDVDIRSDDRFLCSIDQFKQWAGDKSSIRMEFFYRTMRRQHNILMADGQPMGGKWNFDASNRSSLPDHIQVPKPCVFQPDQETQSVINMVSSFFDRNMGDATDFSFAVTQVQAHKVFEQFCEQRLVNFGQYQDAMREGDAWLFHAHIALYLNSGLLLPEDCVRQVEALYMTNQAPLAAVEGFIRQIMGWREFVRGVYWLKMPDYAELNTLNATRALPDFYWSGKTKMNCVRLCVSDTIDHAYAHHIQRLMVLGNFALISGVDPKAVNDWFLSVYADAYEWVEMPNVSGMSLYADGGYFASKPYASGGSYINKMSNYCKNCHYRVKEKVGKKACPFNYLYWDFLNRHRSRFKGNPRMAMMYRTYDKMSEEKKQAIALDSQIFLDQMD